MEYSKQSLAKIMSTVRFAGIVIIILSFKSTPVFPNPDSPANGSEKNETITANDANRFPENETQATLPTGDSLAAQNNLSHLHEEQTFNFNASNLNSSSSTDDVYRLIATETFIDKSLLIKDYLEKTWKVTFISRPHGWGKTTNLKMLKLFLEIEMDKSGNRVPDKKSMNRKLFLGGELPTVAGKPLNPLKIARFKNITDTALGTHPVIFANLKNFGTSYEEIEKGIRLTVARLFGEHEYLLKRLKLKTDKDLFKKYRNEQTTLTRLELERGLAVLTELVGKHFKRTVHLLVDDYDTAINHLFAAIIVRIGNQHSHDKRNDSVLFDEVYKTKDLSDSFLLYRSVLFHCTELGNATVKMLVTGIQPSLLLTAEPQDIIECSVREHQFSAHFGFSEAEVEHALKQVPFAVDGTALKEWYAGYHFGVGHVYNPSSVIRCLAAGGKFGIYWTDRDDAAQYLSLANVVLSLDETQENTRRLLDGKNITFNLNRKILFHNLFDGGLFSILLFHGYLNYGAAMEIDTLSVPNREIESILKVKLLTWVYRKSKQMRKDWFEAMHRLSTLKVGFEDELRQLTKQVSSLATAKNDTQHSTYYGAMQKCLMYASKYDSVVLNALRNITNLTTGNNYPQ